MRILGIETSCDETAAAIVEDGTKIISSALASSADMHAKTGGIIPEIAARQQIKSIIPVINETLISGNCKTSRDVNAIAVTVGPGLLGSLLVGVETAKTLAYIWNKPIIPVNHLTGHIYANWVKDDNDKKLKAPEFPLLALVVSGGHTDLVLMRAHGKIRWIGGTRDDAAGEAFDKSARVLGLPYPGGPSISKEAEKFFTNNPNPKLILFPRPLINEKNFDWSFSGLKTAVIKHVNSQVKNNNSTAQLATEVQEAIVESLVTKALRAVESYKPKGLVLAGGVAANKRLRDTFERKLANKSVFASLHVPKPKLCTDNAIYIASCAFFNYKPIHWSKITALPDLTITD